MKTQWQSCATLERAALEGELARLLERIPNERQTFAALYPEPVSEMSRETLCGAIGVVRRTIDANEQKHGGAAR